MVYNMPVEPLPNGVEGHHSPECKCQIRAQRRVVLKFGGTSIGKYPLQIAGIIS